jgi:hypothetical protein
LQDFVNGARNRLPGKNICTIIDRFPPPPVAPPIGDTSLTHVMKLAAHSTKPPTPTTMVQYFIMTLYIFAPEPIFVQLLRFWTLIHLRIENCNTWSKILQNLFVEHKIFYKRDIYKRPTK